MCGSCYFNGASNDIKIRSERSPIHSKIVLFGEGVSLILGDFFSSFVVWLQKMYLILLFFTQYLTLVSTLSAFSYQMKRIWVKTTTVTHSYSPQPDKWI